MQKKKINKNKIQQRRSARNANRMQNSNNQLPDVIPVISRCTKDYMTCLTNPFRAISPLPCIPDVISLYSNKFRTRSWGTLSTNAAGQGEIGVNPYRTAPNDDINAVFITSSTFAPGIGNDFNYTAATVGLNPATMTGPYSTAQLNNAQTQLRLVGCGVKVRYAGTMFNMSGRVTIFRAPANAGLQSGSINNLLAIPQSRKCSMQRVWRSVTYVPDDPDFLGYQTLAQLNTASPTNLAVLIIVIDGVTGGATSFDYEVSAYWEMIGSVTIASANWTSSHADPAGMAAAIGAIPQKLPSSSPERQEKKGIWDLGLEIRQNLSHVIYNVGNSYMQNMAKQYASQRLAIKGPESTTTVEEVDEG